MLNYKHRSAQFCHSNDIHVQSKYPILRPGKLILPCQDQVCQQLLPSSPSMPSPKTQRQDESLHSLRGVRVLFAILAMSRAYVQLHRGGHAIKVVAIHQTLYVWREHPKSVSNSYQIHGNRLLSNPNLKTKIPKKENSISNLSSLM